MKVNIEIECTPVEARQFFELPNLEPMQAAVMQQLEQRHARGYRALLARGLDEKLAGRGSAGRRANARLFSWNFLAPEDDQRLALVSVGPGLADDLKARAGGIWMPSSFDRSRRWQVEIFPRLPFACVRAAVHVQDFTCCKCGVGQEQNCIHDSADFTHSAHRVQSFEELMGLRFMHWSIDGAQRNDVHTNTLVGIFHCEWA